MTEDEISPDLNSIKRAIEAQKKRVINENNVKCKWEPSDGSLAYRENVFEIGDKVTIYSNKTKISALGSIINLSAIDLRIKLENNSNIVRVSLVDLEKGTVQLNYAD